MLKIKPIQNIPYAELSQPIPMRWCLAFRDEDDNLIPQHSWWKCKDFLNDVVIYLRTGKEFEIYDFKNKADINEEGGYMLLRNVASFFEDNLSLLNEFLLERGFDPIEVFEHDGAYSVQKVILIPGMYWDNTFLISAITSLIRSCGYKKWEDKPNFEVELTLNGFFKQLSDFMVSENLQKMYDTLFLNYQYSNGKHPDPYTLHTYHNAGLQNWLNTMNTFKVAA